MHDFPMFALNAAGTWVNPGHAIAFLFIAAVVVYSLGVLFVASYEINRLIARDRHHAKWRGIWAAHAFRRRLK